MGEWMEFVKPVALFLLDNWAWVSVVLWVVFVISAAIWDRTPLKGDVLEDYFFPVFGCFLAALAAPLLLMIFILLFPILAGFASIMGVAMVGLWFSKKKRGII